MVAWSFYAALCVVLTVAAYFRYFWRKRRAGEPVIVPGSLLWGNGAEFAENAVSFIHKQQKKFGDVFTIRLLNQYLTIIADPHSYERVCREKNFDFDPIQKQVNHNVFSFSLMDTRKMMSEASKTVKGHYLQSTMKQFSEHLNSAFNNCCLKDVNSNEKMPSIPENDWQQDGLRNMASKTMFKALFCTIFGAGKSGDEFEPLVVYKHFDIFHKYFNFLWLGLPINLFPAAGKALEALCKQPSAEELLSREDVSPYIKFSTEFMMAHGQTASDVMGHNLVYLHVNYNTFRVAFWCMYLLMEHREAMDALRKEVNDFVAEKAEYAEADEEVTFTLEEIEGLKTLDSIVKETMRYTSGVFMVRSITNDTWFEMEDGSKHLMREGDRVAIYPPAIHKDPEIFENPNTFQYDRFVDTTFYKNGREVKNPLLAFAALCPGKKLAISQTKWFMFSLLHMFDIELLAGEKTVPDLHYHGHEILPPTNEVNMKYRLRQHSRKLSFV